MEMTQGGRPSPREGACSAVAAPVLGLMLAAGATAAGWGW